MLNNVSIQGRLVRDPEGRTTQTGKHLVKFTLACERSKEDVSFIDCAAWGEIAKNVEKHLKKGSMCVVKGRLKTSTYTFSSKDGTKSKVKRVEVIVEGGYLMHEVYG